MENGQWPQALVRIMHSESLCVCVCLLLDYLLYCSIFAKGNQQYHVFLDFDLWISKMKLSFQIFTHHEGCMPLLKGVLSSMTVQSNPGVCASRIKVINSVR